MVLFRLRTGQAKTLNYEKIDYGRIFAADNKGFSHVGTKTKAEGEHPCMYACMYLCGSAFLFSCNVCVN